VLVKSCSRSSLFAGHESASQAARMTLTFFCPHTQRSTSPPPARCSSFVPIRHVSVGLIIRATRGAARRATASLLTHRDSHRKPPTFPLVHARAHTTGGG
jgi:hypothetical protein